MRRAEVNLIALWGIILSMSGVIVPIVEPHLAGILGGIMYLIVRHESKTATFSVRSMAIVMFMGYTGAWATVNILPVYYPIHEHVIKGLSFFIGFIMYDFYMMLGANTRSVIGVVFDSVKEILQKAVEKWKA